MGALDPVAAVCGGGLAVGTLVWFLASLVALWRTRRRPDGRVWCGAWAELGGYGVMVAAAVRLVVWVVGH